MITDLNYKNFFGQMSLTVGPKSRVAYLPGVYLKFSRHWKENWGGADGGGYKNSSTST